MITRRMFLAGSAAAALNLGGCARLMNQPQSGGVLRSVTIDVSLPTSGIFLPHEHVLVDFIGADAVDPSRYRRDEVFEQVLPRLKAARAAGITAVAECTPAWLGRDPQLLRELSIASDVVVLTNTGYYGASNNKFLPRHAHQESAEQLAERWTAEARNGLDGTRIRPGFIKIGVDPGPLSPLHRKLITAAALTHRATALTIASHSTDAVCALEQIAVLEGMHADPANFIWVHAQAEPDPQHHITAARAGAWVEFDGLQPDTLEQHLILVGRMRAERLLHRTLISHDGGWFQVGEPNGGLWREWNVLGEQFIPRLRALGWSEQEIVQLTRINPGLAFQLETTE